MNNEKHTWLAWYPGAIALAKQILNGSEEATDIVQSAYLKGMQQTRMPSEENAQKAWMLKVVRNACIDFIRSQRKFQAGADVDESSGSNSPECALEASQQAQRMNAALMQLPLEMREILVLREVNELPYDGIASVLKVEKGTVMSRLHRARMALRKKFMVLESERGEV